MKTLITLVLGAISQKYTQGRTKLELLSVVWAKVLVAATPKDSERQVVRLLVKQ